MSRPDATRRFAALSALAVLGTGVVVHALVRDSISNRTADSALATSRIVTALVVEELGGTRGWEGLGGPAGTAVRRLVEVSPRMQAVEVYDAKGASAYRTGPAANGTPAQVRRALSGRVAARDVGADAYEVAVPVLGDDGRLAGVVAVRLDIADDRREAAHDERLLLGSLFGCLLLLWLLMWWLAATVHRTLRRRATDQEQLAVTDALTGLPNRRRLVVELDRVVAGQGGVLLLLDVDRFKEVNDSLGHAVGDQLLQVVGRRLVETFPDARVARLGGDEFAVLLGGARTPEQGLVQADRAREAMAVPVQLDGLVLDVEVSVGLALAPDQAQTTSQWLRCADVAMYASKQSGQGPRMYDPALDAHEPDRLLLLGDLRRALGAGQLSLVYQPVWDLQREGRCLAVEALVRWDHPDRGAIAPEELVALGERSGQVRALTRFVLDEALGQWTGWVRAGADLHLAVNISARNLQEDDLPEALAELMTRHGVPPDRVILEVTESAFVTDPDRAAAVVRRLAGLGCHVSVDDFGTGWSSMSRLLQMPLQALKIDRTFVGDLPSGPGAPIVSSTIGLAHDLGLYVVAEGVETLVQLERLRELGCDCAQGFLLSTGIPSAQVPATAARRLGPSGLTQPGAAQPGAAQPGMAQTGAARTV